MSELTTSVEPPGSGPARGTPAYSRPGLMRRPPGLIDEESRDPLVEVAIPVYNEQHVLVASVRRLHAYLRATFPYRFVITIADNASTDGTWDVAERLALEIPEVDAVHL